MSLKLGNASTLYVNTNIDGDGIPDRDSPTWSDVTGISEFASPQKWTTVQILERGDRVEAGVKTTLNINFTGKIRVNEDSATFVLIRDALQSPDEYLDLLVLDGPKDEVGSVGVRADYQIADGTVSQGPGEVLYMALEGVRYPSGRQKSYVEIEVADVLTEIAI